MAALRLIAARLTEEHAAKGLGETGRRQAADQRQAADDEHTQQRPSDSRIAARVGNPQEHAEVDQQLADKTVQRRQPGNGTRPHEKRRPR